MKNTPFCFLKLISRCLFFVASLAVDSAAANEAPVFSDQGGKWTTNARQDFYSVSQGSQLIELSWINALKQPNGQPFMADSLGRYGFLPNDQAKAAGLPVGFTLDSHGDGPGSKLGITCSACHTRQIEVAGTRYRIDGGPAIVDFQSFFADLDSAVANILADPQAFGGFARAVAGASYNAETEISLRKLVQDWYTPYHAITSASLPNDTPWGYGRLDAISMIFNRVAGLDIGPPPTYMISENFAVADAPVRFPFLWNAAIQDKTQWPGFTDNGDNLLALVRNLGEVYGVFGQFHPKKDPDRLLGIDYLDANSADFRGLDDLEFLVQKLGPPKWPWPVDGALASQGKTVYDRPTAQDGCVECHRVVPGQPRLLNKHTWDTPVQDVGTDAREYAVLTRAVKTGVLEGAQIPTFTVPLKPMDGAANVLGLAVRGSVLQRMFPVRPGAEMLQNREKIGELLSGQIKAMEGVYRNPEKADKPHGFAYESRVLQGIWATAPYLHNGSVRSLAELLKPADERAAEFKIGPNYDPVTIGLAVDQPRFGSTLRTTGHCDGRDRRRDSGSSRCGHEYGARLPDGDKKALLEYLKTL